MKIKNEKKKKIMKNNKKNQCVRTELYTAFICFSNGYHVKINLRNYYVTILFSVICEKKWKQTKYA